MLRYEDRGYEQDLLLVPGWAFDERIFAELDLPCNYLLFTGMSMAALEPACLRRLDTHSARPLSLLGWSQGAVAVSHLAVRHPERVRRVFLVGMRQAYSRQDCDIVRGFIGRKRRVYLQQFYKMCFKGSETQHYRRFATSLQPAYLERFTADHLYAGLDWLANTPIPLTQLAGLHDVTLVHGCDDQIAPMADARALAARLPGAHVCQLPACGHVPFGHPGFAELFHDRQNADKA